MGQLGVAPSERTWIEVLRSRESKQPQQQRAANQQLGAHFQMTWIDPTIADFLRTQRRCMVTTACFGYTTNR